MITKHPWFGPKTGMGWGWTPVTWQGWLVTLACVATMIILPLALFRHRHPF